jgi:hypothetical protein
MPRPYLGRSIAFEAANSSNYGTIGSSYGYIERTAR